MHDPLAVAAILAGRADEIAFYDHDTRKGATARRRERYRVTVVTDGSHADAQLRGAQTGRTILELLPEGEEGVRVPRAVDVAAFWRVIEQCCQRADELNLSRATVSAAAK